MPGVYKPKRIYVCERCGKEYLPRAWNSKYCLTCRPIVIAEQKRVANLRAIASDREGYLEKHRIRNAKSRDRMAEYMTQYYHTPSGKDSMRRARLKHRHALRAAGTLDIEAFYAKCSELGWHCQVCGKELTKDTVTIDHIVPVSKGGTNDSANLQPLCRPCNTRKGNRPLSSVVGSAFLFD